jgi:SM-20-related protein
MLNPYLDFAPAALTLQRTGRVVIADALHPDFAQSLYQALQDGVPFDLKIRDLAGQKTLNSPLSEAQYSAALSAAHSTARTHFAFAYEGFDLIGAYLQQQKNLNANAPLPAAQALMMQLVEQLNAPDFLDFVRRLTAEPALRRIDAQATRYRAGHFLLRHNDFSATEDRRFAYVINLSKNWRADWGGVLQFFDAPHQASAAQIETLPLKIIDTVCPAFNSLSIFKVPQWHCVSPVASFVTAQRLGITGWMQA